jgi:glycosyltransferase involved in cell wall biosynthesis
LRVLYLNHTSLISGGEQCLFDTLEALPAGVDAVVACPPGALTVALEARGVRIIPVTGTAGSLRLHPVHTPLAIVQLLRAAAEVMLASRRLRIDVIHANSLRAGLVAVLASQLGGPPAIVHAHDRLPPSRASDAVNTVIARGATTVLAISRYTARPFEARGARRVVVGWNPLNVERFKPGCGRPKEFRREIGLSDEMLVGMVGQITPWKGQAEAIGAMAHVVRELPDAHLAIVGAPTFVSRATRHDNEAYLRRLHELVRVNDLDGRVHFTGARVDVVSAMEACDVLVVPSHAEPFGRVVIEAMALSRPVIATNVGGPAEYLTDGRDGVLLPPCRPAEWGRSTIELLNAPYVREALGRRARETVAAKFSAGTYVSRLVAVYREAIACRGGRRADPRPSAHR